MWNGMVEFVGKGIDGVKFVWFYCGWYDEFDFVVIENID